MSQAEMRRCLEECDVAGIRALWRTLAPNLPQPEDDEDALATIHHARTQTESIRFKLRAYSHSWLIERGLPSALPDQLRPRAERLYPRIVEGVGISVNSMSAGLKPLVVPVREAMEKVVLDAYANGDRDPVLLKKLMQEARTGTMRKLLG